MKCKSKLSLNPVYFGKFEDYDDAIKGIFVDAYEKFDGVHLSPETEHAVLLRALYEHSLNEKPSLTWNKFIRKKWRFLKEIIDEIGALEGAYPPENLIAQQQSKVDDIWSSDIDDDWD